jgi:chitin biosynthesis protein CHS5
MVPIASFYLGSTFNNSQQFSTRPQSMSQVGLTNPPSSPPTQPRSNVRQSMPAPARSAPDQAAGSKRFETMPEEPSEQRPTSMESKRKSRSGTMNREFKFPSPTSPSPSEQAPRQSTGREERDMDDAALVAPAAPPIVEVPPPPPVEKERTGAVMGDDVDEDVGPTEEISLN